MSKWRDRVEQANRHLNTALAETANISSSAWFPLCVAYKHLERAEEAIAGARAELDKTTAIKEAIASGIGIAVDPFPLPTRRHKGRM